MQKGVLHRLRFDLFVLGMIVFGLLPVGEAYGFVYTIKSRVNLRSGPGLQYPAVMQLEQNRSLKMVSKENNWFKVADLTGREGYVREDMVSDWWIKVHKQERKLLLMQGAKDLKRYKIALSAANPEDDKMVQGDCGTPEGRFFVCESLRDPGQAKYGARSMRLSYPNTEDARRGLKDKRINYDTYVKIVQAIKSGRTPEQGTSLGGSIRIHGGGSSFDWTLGCIALEDNDIINLFNSVPDKVRVEVYKSSSQDQEINSTEYLQKKILDGVSRQLEAPALYTSEACGLIDMGYPLGDIMPDQAVCTDVVIRALRSANMDLQVLVHEDILMHPDRYARWVRNPNPIIDHRRTRNLQRFFENHCQVLTIKSASFRDLFRPGDIVTLDTGVTNGTDFDHIGIVSDQLNPVGIPLVFNIWDVGERTRLMDLLEKTYPRVMGHFRLGHPFDYQ